MQKIKCNPRFHLQFLLKIASSLTPPRSESASIGGTKHAKESSDTDDSDDEMENEEEEDDEDEEEIPLDLEEVEAVSKKARQDEEIHSEHMQVKKSFRIRNFPILIPDIFEIRF